MIDCAVELTSSLAAPSLAVMDFLNEAVNRYPKAISFGPGRPSERLFDIPAALDGVDRWVAHSTVALGRPASEVWASLGQYGQTAGLIQDLVAQHLAIDAGIDVAPEAILITSGCQEAMVIVLLGLFEPATDTLLVSDPTYIGITGFARLVGIPVYPVPSSEDGLDPKDVEAAIRAVRQAGRRPRAIYDIPDFNNPLGTSMPLSSRSELLAIAHRHSVLVLEDNPYGTFAYEGFPAPTLKSLDSRGVVIYLGSFAKTLFPGLRIGYLVADQKASGTHETVATALAKVKSFTTINTPPLMQAIAGAALLAHHGSLAPTVAAKLPFYRANRDRMLQRLAENLGDMKPAVIWNRPAGGFFLRLRLPFDFGKEELHLCAREYGVIVCPMAFFGIAVGREQEVRLSFSCVDSAEIDEGVARLSRFVRDYRCGGTSTCGP